MCSFIANTLLPVGRPCLPLRCWMDEKKKKSLKRLFFFCFCFFLQVPHADSVEVTGLKKVSPKSAAKRLSNVNPACESIGKALDSKNMLSLFGNKKQAKKWLKNTVHTYEKEKKTCWQKTLHWREKKIMTTVIRTSLHQQVTASTSSVHMSITHLYRHRTLHITLLLMSSPSNDSLKSGFRQHKQKSKKRRIVSRAICILELLQTASLPSHMQLIFACELHCMTCKAVGR